MQAWIKNCLMAQPIVREAKGVGERSRGGERWWEWRVRVLVLMIRRMLSSVKAKN